MKTKEELLKIYSSYLPYELKFENESETYQLTEINTTDIEYNVWACNRWDEQKLQHLPSINVKDNSLGKGFKLNEVKPIFYSMDWLSSPIECKGYKVIPSKEILDYFGAKGDNIYFDEGNILIMNKSKNIKYKIIWAGELADDCPIWIYKKLLEWHFNVFGLSDSEYIKKETLNQ